MLAPKKQHGPQGGTRLSKIEQALRARLAEYDGRAVTFLGEAEAALSSEPGYHGALIALAADGEGNISGGATWLLKSALENGAALSAPQTAALCEQLPDLADWQAQLHLCQLIRHLSIPDACAAQMADWLGPLLTHKRPFLRAWSLDALGSLSSDHPHYRAAFEQALTAAQQDDAASVRARARNVGM